MRFFLFFSTFILFFFKAHGILVLEPYDDESQKIIHGELVSQIACPLTKDCELIYLDDVWSESQTHKINASLSNHKVLNMSFAFQTPSAPHPLSRSNSGEASYSEQVDNYYKRLSAFKDLFENNPNHLFVIAAGNGYSIRELNTDGIPLIKRNTMYPPSFTYENALKVTSLNTDSIEINKLESYEIDKYANYSVDMVDLAAPVPSLKDGIRGTSFAAPLVSRLAKIAADQGLSVREIKEVFYKSSYVQNLEQSIELTKDYLTNKKSSLIYKIQNESNRAKREKLLSRLEIMFAKSGGPLVEKVFKQCLQNYIKTNASIEEACLDAHKSILGLSSKRRDLLQVFWSLRKL